MKIFIFVSPLNLKIKFNFLLYFRYKLKLKTIKKKLFMHQAYMYLKFELNKLHNFLFLLENKKCYIYFKILISYIIISIINNTFLIVKNKTPSPFIIFFNFIYLFILYLIFLLLLYI